MLFDLSVPIKATVASKWP